MAKESKQEPLSVPMQEALLALLCYHDKAGTEVNSILTADDFDGAYKPLAQRVMRYRAEHKKAPGTENMTVLIDNLPLPEKQLSNLHTFNNELGSLSRSFNGSYLAKQAHIYIRHRALTTATRDLAKVLSNTKQQAEEVEEAERILYTALRKREAGYAKPHTLADTRQVLDDVFAPHERALSLGIDTFDRHNIGLMPGHMLLYISRKSSGKSWFCVHAGQCGYTRGKHVLHVSLEMSVAEVEARYTQSLGRIGVTGEKFVKTVLTRDSWDSELIKPQFHRGYGADDPKEKEALKRTRKLLEKWNSRLAGVYIAAFPTGSLTVDKFTNYLDFLASHHKYSPHIVIIDYPDLMQLDAKNIRVSLIDTYKRLRGLAVERNFALVCPTQSNRAGYEENTVDSSHVSEAIDKVFTADTVLTYSQTEGEADRNIARLKVSHARTTSSNVQVVISQAYHIGQYVTGSVPIWRGYHDQVREHEQKLAKRKKGELGSSYADENDENDDSLVPERDMRGHNVVKMPTRKRDR